MSEEAEVGGAHAGAAPPKVDVLIDAGDFEDAPVGRLERAVRATFGAEGIEAGQISLALLDDDAIRDMNVRHLGRDRPTDVLAFALWEAGEAVVGDVYVGGEQARKQAAEAEVSVAEEFVRLAVHGVLHVLGYDHPEAAEARRASPMYARQEEIVSQTMEEGV